MINNYIFKSYINNSSDILSISNDTEFKNIISSLNKKQKIFVKSHLIHKSDYIDQIEQFIFNLDNYISFLKELIFIKPLEIRYIIHLTLYNEYNKILYSDLYYYDNLDIYKSEFVKIFMHKYYYNYNIISKYIDINKKSFQELIEILNNKKRTYIYFDDISKYNISYYLELYKILEN